MENCGSGAPFFRLTFPSLETRYCIQKNLGRLVKKRSHISQLRMNMRLKGVILNLFRVCAQLAVLSYIIKTIPRRRDELTRKFYCRRQTCRRSVISKDILTRECSSCQADHSWLISTGIDLPTRSSMTFWNLWAIQNLNQVFRVVVNSSRRFSALTDDFY